MGRGPTLDPGDTFRAAQHGSVAQKAVRDSVYLQSRDEHRIPRAGLEEVSLVSQLGFFSSPL